MPTTWLDTLVRQTRRVGTFPFPHQAAFLLERVLELGPGPGFFGVEIARRLTDGRHDLFDIQPEMLDKARRKL